ncbi:MAG: hypothetical protein QOJ04_3852 [Caballeronia sp.]|jgi:DNA-binding GntR family transcriptional regulator|nr:hypothetical protein [Caballeronia sp.]MEA3115603.1 hypothetical protein [Caballeronia sp.]
MRFDNLYEMREMIETFAIRKFCRGGAPAIDLIRLLDALDAIWQVPLDERFTDGREVATLDKAFHQTLVSAAGNDELTAALQCVTDRIRVVRRLDLVYGNCVDETYVEHAAILRAIRAGRTDEAVTGAARHIRVNQAEVRKLTVPRLHSVRTTGVRRAAPDAPVKG